MTSRASVVIPAYNEQAVLRRCLDGLLDGAEPAELEVVVVANGCTDRSADVAREFADRGVTCIETEVASKSNAINLGDEAVTTFPRIYLDADVVITIAAAREIADVLSTTDYLAAAPRVRIDASRSDYLAKAYFRVLESLPVFASGYVGSGCYALSERGRARFERFPDIIGDDKFINDLFTSDEKLTIQDQVLQVTAPTNLRSTIRRGLRVRAGSVALDEQDDGANRSVGSTKQHLRRLARRPAGLRDVAVFTGVQVITIGWARIRRLRGADRAWLRDETSRT